MNDSSPQTAVDLLGVIVAVTDRVPRILVVEHGDEFALPNGPFVPDDHMSLEDGFRQIMEAQAGLDLYYVEQLYTFGNRYRSADEVSNGSRLLSVAYVALTREEPVASPGTRWADWYEFLPWEDWRDGRPDRLDSLIAPRLAAWRQKTRAQEKQRNREERINVTFGTPGAAELDAVLTLERLELLYDAGILAEAGPRPACNRRQGAATGCCQYRDSDGV